MTTVTIRRAPGRCRLTAAGHATGSSAVCAAVSGLVYALAGYLKNLERAGAVTLDELRLEPGDAAVEASGGAAFHPFGMAAVGLMQIAAGFPEQVKIYATPITYAVVSPASGGGDKEEIPCKSK